MAGSGFSTALRTKYGRVTGGEPRTLLVAESRLSWTTAEGWPHLKSAENGKSPVVMTCTDAPHSLSRDQSRRIRMGARHEAKNYVQISDCALLVRASN